MQTHFFGGGNKRLAFSMPVGHALSGKEEGLLEDSVGM